MIKSFNRIRGVLIVWIVSYAVFLICLANNFSASHDSIHYLLGIVKGENLFHQHHLLYHWLANKWLVFWRSFFNCGPFPPLVGVGRSALGGLLFCREHYMIQAFSALWGSSALSMIYLFFRRRFFLPRASSLLGVAAVAFSYGLWFYSVNIEVYMPPLFFILYCLYILTKSNLTGKDIFRAAILHSLAILFHQINVLFAVVAVYSIYRNNLRSSVLPYIMTGLVLCGGAYFITGWLVEGNNSMGSWIRWMQGYAVGHNYWQPPSLRTPLHVITGFSHAFIGGHFVFQIPAIEGYLLNSFHTHSLKDEIFLSRDLSGLMAIFLGLLSVVFAVIMTILVLRFAAKLRAIKIEYPVVSSLLLTLLVYSLFFCFWMPEILEFWILQMVLVLLLLIGTLPLTGFPFNLRVNSVITILAAIMFTVNFYGSIRWLRNFRYDWYGAETLKIGEVIKADDIIIVENEWILKDYLRYYTNAKIIATDEPAYDKKETERLINEKRNAEGAVYLYRNGLTKIAD